MAEYFAMRIIKGKLSYDKVVSTEKYSSFKLDIDDILIAEGYEHLITKE